MGVPEQTRRQEDNHEDSFLHCRLYGRSRNLDLTQRLMLILGMGITATDTGLMAMDTMAIDTMDTMERDPLMKLPLPNLDPTLMLMLILGTDITAMATGLTAMDTMAIDTDTMDTMERDPLSLLKPNLDPMLMLKLILGTDITAMPTGLMAMDTTDTVLMDILTGVKSMPSTTSLPTLL